MGTQKSVNIRLKAGEKITSLQDLRRWQASVSGDKMLLGSASNHEVVKKDTALYSDDDLYTRERVYLPYEGMAAVNLAIGPMGSGKTNLLNSIIYSRPEANMIIHDRKGEYNVSFYDPEKDIIVAYPDKWSVIWDVFAEIKKDRQIGELIWRNMLLSVRGGDDNKEGEEWVTYAVSWLMKLAGRIIDGNVALVDIPVEIVRLFKEFKADVGTQQTGMQSDALGTASPVFNLLFQMYNIGVRDDRYFVTVTDMTKVRRVFICNSKQFSAQLDIVNNALLACLVNHYLSRPNIPREQTDRYSYFILDEFLTFKLDKESETALLTLCRSKGVSVWLGMQHLPDDKKRTTTITASRYMTAVFRLDDKHTRDEIEALTDDVEYQRHESTLSLGDTGSLVSLTGGLTMNEALVDLKTKQVSKAVLADLTPYVAYVEVKDLVGRYRTFVLPPYVSTIKNPCRLDESTDEEGFLYSDAARFCKRIEEVI